MLYYVLMETYPETQETLSAQVKELSNIVLPAI